MVGLARQASPQSQRAAVDAPGRMEQGRVEQGLAGGQPVQPLVQAVQENKQIEVSSALPPHTELNKLSGACVAAAWRLVKRSWLCVMVTLQRGECQ